MNAQVSLASSHKSAQDFDYMSEIDHIIKRCNLYIGSIKECPRMVDIYNIEEDRIEQRKCSWPVGAVQLFNEILSNAVDNYEETCSRGYTNIDPSSPFIEISMDGNCVSVLNYGEPIPVEYHSNFGSYVPTMIFGHLRTSSNYNLNQENQSRKRHGAGQNGLGAKIVNIFSSQFTVEINDMLRGASFQQTWTNSMKETSGPLLAPAIENCRSYTRITYYLNFSLLGASAYPEEALYMYMAIAAANAATAKCRIRFNSTLFDKLLLPDYLGMIFPSEALNTAVYHYVLADSVNTSIQKKKYGRKKIPVVLYNDAKVQFVPRPLVEIAVLDPEVAGRGRVLTYANSIRTLSGLHLDRVYEALVKPIQDYVNKGIRVDDKSEKAKSKNKEAKRRQITPSMIKEGLSLVASFQLENLDFDSQSKTNLTEPRPPPLKIDPSSIEPIYKWNYMKYLKTTLHGLQRAELSLTDGKKTKNINTTLKEDDAKWAGGKRWEEAILLIVEGNSASGYAYELRNQDPDGNNRYGIYVGSGVPPNASTASVDTILKSPDFTSIKKMMGLRENLDYTLPENGQTLRYGYIMTMTDADFDGTHIKTLHYNYLHEFFPSLFAAGRILDYRTKYLEARRGSEIVNFYTEFQYEQWSKKTDVSKYTFKFFKGLGSAETEDVAADYCNMKIVRIFYDQEAPSVFGMAFGRNNSNKRKLWVMQHCADRKKGIVHGYEISSIIELSRFFQYEYMVFVEGSLERGIPRTRDGLKRSYGQIICGAFSKWKIRAGKKYQRKNAMKVSEFAGYISYKVGYHHGEKSLQDTIANLAQNHKGTNNLNILYPNGQFGNRILGREAVASARYNHTYPTSYFGYIFRHEDLPILQYNCEGSKVLDPLHYTPIVPLSLINGSAGIAFAFSNMVPNYNPLEIIERLESMICWVEKYGLTELAKFETPPIIPWYKGHKGSVIFYLKCASDDLEKEEFSQDWIEMIDDRISEEERERIANKNAEREWQNSNQYLIEDNPIQKVEIESNRKVNAVEFYGNFEINPSNGDITVTELPPGLLSKKYELWLEKRKERKELKSFSNDSTLDYDLFVIKGFEWQFNEDGSIKKNAFAQLNLIRRINLNNLTFLGENSVPVCYDTVEDYLKDFFLYRIEYYEKRKKYQLAEMEKLVIKLQYIIQLIEAKKEGRILIEGRPRHEVLNDIEKLGIPREIFKEIRLKDLDADGGAKKRAQLKEEQERWNQLKNRTLTSMWTQELTELKEEVSKDSDNFRQIPGSVVQAIKANRIIEIKDSDNNEEENLSDSVVTFDLDL